MKQEAWRSYYLTDHWGQLRKAIIRKRGYQCEMCKETKNIQLHHTSYENVLGQEKEEDLVLLCSMCHNLVHQDLEAFETGKINGGLLKKDNISCGTYDKV